MAEKNIVQWLCDELSKCLAIETSPEIAEYILGLETQSELEEYLSDLLDISSTQHRQFISELVEKWSERRGQSPASLSPAQVSQPHTSKKTSRSRNVNRKEAHNSPTQQQEDAPQQQSPSDTSAILANNFGGARPKTKIIPQPTPDKKTKSKYVPLFSDEGKSKTAAKIPGRHNCDCQTMKHSLVNNCLSCGRVVCQQEGSGPCFHCGTLVCTKQEQEILDLGNKKSEKLFDQLMGAKGGMSDRNSYRSVKGGNQNGDLHAQQAASKHKDKLLEYDRTSAKRTQVIDDESDYFSVDSRWLSDKERAALKQREDSLRAERFASRLDKRKVTLDFAGRTVTDENTSTNVYNANDSVVQQVYHGKPNGMMDTGQDGRDRPNDVMDLRDLVNPDTRDIAPQFVTKHHTSEKELKRRPKEKSNGNRQDLRIQDTLLSEMSDTGACLSMHQPWASLLVAGIKKHEGRGWYTAHRGRLWIAATAQTPQPEEIQRIEQQYQEHYQTLDLPFPEVYPTGCLLGCVDVIDCLDYTQYHQQFPDNEESESPYVFICDRPHELVVKFPMKGKHKIYKLTTPLHQAGKRGIRPSPAPCLPSTTAPAAAATTTGS